MKITRNVSLQLKEGKAKEFVQLFEAQILPELRKQKGFKEELTLLDNNRALVISLWDDRKDAEMYHTLVYPRMVEKVNALLQGTPKVETFELATTTLAVAA